MIRMFVWLVLGLSCASFFAADYVKSVGVLAKNGKWDVSITYDATVNRASAFSPGNYLLPTNAVIEELRDQPLDNAVILSVSGFSTNVLYNITITNVLSTTGETLSSISSNFTTRSMSWAPVGAQEFGFTPEAVAVGNDGFDLVSGGGEMFGTYDESTFAYERINGDFDKRVRVLAQEPSSPEGRAGLMVREAVDEQKPRPIDPGNPNEAFSRYLQVQVNPLNTVFTDFEGNPVLARNQYQVNIRPLPGGFTENPEISTNVPPYPNAWLRLKRAGQTFFTFRSSDGTNWSRLGTFTFPTTDLDGNPVTPFARAVYVGPNYSPEIGNIPASTGLRRAFLAQFRNYSNASEGVQIEEPSLSIAFNTGQVEVTWSAGTLQGTTNIAGNVWTDLGISSPMKITPDKHAQFFRARNP